MKNQHFLERMFISDNEKIEQEVVRWLMFNTSEEELSNLLIPIGKLTIGDDFLKFTDYPFEPSIAYKQAIFKAEQIDDVDLSAFPPTLRIEKELIFLKAELRKEIEEFTFRNKIKTVERQEIWQWILEPFLDTEYTPETDQKLLILLKEYGFSSKEINQLRCEIEVQMLKYNFDTLLWEWVALGTLDVLRAMRTKYNTEEYKSFYKKVMNIALLEKIT